MSYQSQSGQQETHAGHRAPFLRWSCNHFAHGFQCRCFARSPPQDQQHTELAQSQGQRLPSTGGEERGTPRGPVVIGTIVTGNLYYKELSVYINKTDKGKKWKQRLNKDLTKATQQVSSRVRNRM
ncbi:unnamed protein product [Lepidochelys olivacea]